MTTLERMIRERDRLRAEAGEIDKAIKIMEKYKEPDKRTTPTKILGEKRRANRIGISPALKECVHRALIRHGRPVTKDEIFEFLPLLGFSKGDFRPEEFSTLVHPEYKGEGKGKRNPTIWYGDRPRPQLEEWKKSLTEIGV